MKSQQQRRNIEKKTPQTDRATGKVFFNPSMGEIFCKYFFDICLLF